MIIKDGKFIIYYENEGRVIKGSSLAPEDLEFLWQKEGYAEVDVYPGTSYLIPCCNGFFDEEIELTKFYEMFELEGFSDMIKGVLPEAHQDKAETLVSIAKAIRDRQYVSDKIDKFVYQNPDANRLYKEQQPPKGFTLPFNKTVKQREPGDKLFLKLPDEFVLKNLEAGNPVIYPSIGEVFDPYPSILFSTPFIEPILLSNGSNRKDVVSAAIATLEEYKIGTSESVQKELTAIETAGLPLEYVLGDEYNDDLDIQDNEQEFFDATNAWVLYHTKQYIKRKHAGKTDEELDELVNIFLDRGTIPDHVLDFFNTMIQEAVRYSYSHSPEVPFDVDLISEEEQPEEMVDLIMLVERKDKSALTGDMTTISYISGQAKQYGYKVWIEALIKLLRWGERKPRKLVVPNSAPNSLDLKTFKMSTKTMDISSLEKVRLDSGKYAKAVGIAPGQIFSNGEMRDMLTILMLETSHKVPNTGETISNYQHLYLGDVVDAYVNGEDFIDGISLENGEFVIHDEAIDQVDEIESDLVSKFKPYLTSTMIRFATEKGLNGLITSSSMLTEPKKSHIFLKQYLDIENEMAVGSAELRSQIWYGARLSKDGSNTFLFSEEFSQYVLSDMLNLFLHMKENRHKESETVSNDQNSKSSVFQNRGVTGMSAIVFKGDKASLEWQPLVSTKEFKDEIDPQTQRPKVEQKIVGLININKQNRQLIVASLKDGITQTAGTKPVMLAPVYQWMVDALLIANGVPTTQDQRLQTATETSLTEIMSIRLI